MKKIILAALLVLPMTSVAFGQTTPIPGGGLGNPQFAKGNPVPPGIVTGTAQPPGWSAIGAPSTPGGSGSIIGGGTAGPTGVTAAGSPNNPGVNQPSIPHGPQGR
jgi:hypothetical protein